MKLLATSTNRTDGLLDQREKKMAKKVEEQDSEAIIYQTRRKIALDGWGV